MYVGSGDTITVLLAVTHVALTVIDLELQLAAAKVTVIVELHPLGAAHSYPSAVLVTTYQVVAVQDGVNSEILIFPLPSKALLFIVFKVTAQV